MGNECQKLCREDSESDLQSSFKVISLNSKDQENSHIMKLQLDEYKTSQMDSLMSFDLSVNKEVFNNLKDSQVQEILIQQKLYLQMKFTQKPFFEANDPQTQITEQTLYIQERILKKEFEDCFTVGPIISSNNSVYKGQQLYGMKYGYGQLIYEDGSQYEGFWLNDTKHGPGQRIDEKGNLFKEQWFGDQKLYDSIEMNFQELCINKGKALKAKKLNYTKNESGTYYSQYDQNQSQPSFGYFIANNDSEYYGYLQNFQFHGFGIYYYADSKVYYGQWKDGMMSGIGHYQERQGVVYKGDFVNNQKQGCGAYIFSNGLKFRGHFLNGKKHGPGKIIDQNGNARYAQWNHGKVKK